MWLFDDKPVPDIRTPPGGGATLWVFALPESR